MGRTFDSGAYRDGEEGKNDYEGFLSPLVIEAFGDYMTKHKKQSNGEIRDSDKWQKGIEKKVYIKSAFRHFVDMWKGHRGHRTENGMEDAICGVLFNVMGYYHEYLKEKK